MPCTERSSSSLLHSKSQRQLCQASGHQILMLLFHLVSGDSQCTHLNSVFIQVPIFTYIHVGYIELVAGVRLFPKVVNTRKYTGEGVTLYLHLKDTLLYQWPCPCWYPHPTPRRHLPLLTTKSTLYLKLQSFKSNPNFELQTSTSKSNFNYKL